jgi:DmsE family decaheme c-type cytochrome
MNRACQGGLEYSFRFVSGACVARTSDARVAKSADSIRTLTRLGRSGLIVLAALGFGQSVRAGESSSFHNSYSALAAFVQQIDAKKLNAAKGDTAEPTREFADKALFALSDFVQRIGADNPMLIAANEASKSDPWATVRAASPRGPAVPPRSRSTPPAEDASYVGSDACMGCHAPVAQEFGHTLMGKIAKVKKGTMECEYCHGPGSAHVKAGGGRGVGGIISFRKEDKSRTAAENNAICLGCHDKGDHSLWQGSPHETRGVACTNCHTVMKNVSRKHQLKTAFEPDTCFQCHKNKRAEMWRTAHMPVREGKMTCTSCHNPHGSFSEALLREVTTNDNCYKCHAEKRGPFLFEHAPVRENCLNCHDPHGSINDFLLKISRPRLCQQCHSAATGHPANPRNPFSVFAINRECQNCHSQHHGSNSPSGARFQR